MHHNLSEATQRRLTLCLATNPHHLNRRRRFQQRTVAVAIVLWVVGWFAAVVHIVTTAR